MQLCPADQHTQVVVRIPAKETYVSNCLHILRREYILDRYLSGIKQHYLIPLACVLIATIGGTVLAILQKPVYQVSSIMMVEAGEPASPFYTSLSPYDSIGIAANYASEIMSRSAMDFVYKYNPQIKERGYTTDDLLANVSTSSSPTASTISILAKATNKSDAVLFANSVATGFEAYLHVPLQQQVDAERNGLQNEINQYIQDKTQLEKQIVAIDNNNDPRVVAYQTNIQNDNQTINQLQNQLIQLSTVISPNVLVIQLATDHDVTSRSALISVAITGVVGLLVGATIMLLIIFLDNRLYSEEEVKEKLGFAYLGNIPDNELIKAPFTLTTADLIKRECTDISTNLRLTGVGDPQISQSTVLLVTSAQSTEGKTTVATVLATTLARRGNSVIVIDGNLSQPTTHIAFGMSTAGFGLESLLSSPQGDAVDNLVQLSTIPGVWLLPVGKSVDDSPFFLDQKLPNILSQLRKKAGWIIIDGPSLLSCADASLMASMADGIALVVDCKHTKLSLLLRAKEILTSSTHKPVGVILNRFSGRCNNSYYIATAHSPNISGENEERTKTGVTYKEDTEYTNPSLKSVALTNKF